MSDKINQLIAQETEKCIQACKSDYERHPRTSIISFEDYSLRFHNRIVMEGNASDVKNVVKSFHEGTLEKALNISNIHVLGISAWGDEEMQSVKDRKLIHPYRYCGISIQMIEKNNESR